VKDIAFVLAATLLPAIFFGFLLVVITRQIEGGGGTRVPADEQRCEDRGRAWVCWIETARLVTGDGQDAGSIGHRVCRCDP
jgi:hypothetical protein